MLSHAPIGAQCQIAPTTKIPITADNFNVLLIQQERESAPISKKAQGHRIIAAIFSSAGFEPTPKGRITEETIRDLYYQFLPDLPRTIDTSLFTPAELGMEGGGL